MAVRQTSIKAYHELADLGQRQQEVLEAFAKHGEHTDFEITVLMNRENDEYYYPNKVRPRRNELTEMDLLEEKTRRECEVSGKTAIVWKLTKKGRRLV